MPLFLATSLPVVFSSPFPFCFTLFFAFSLPFNYSYPFLISFASASLSRSFLFSFSRHVSLLICLVFSALSFSFSRWSLSWFICLFHGPFVTFALSFIMRLDSSSVFPWSFWRSVPSQFAYNLPYLLVCPVTRSKISLRLFSSINNISDQVKRPQQRSF